MRIVDDVSKLLLKLFQRKNSTKDLVARARYELHLSGRGGGVKRGAT